MNATRTCSIDGCRNPHKARGYCMSHYRKKHKSGEIQGVRAIAPRGSTLKQRVEFVGWDIADDGCWEWRGHTDRHGYARIARGVEKEGQAYRATYRAYVGEIPSGMAVHHKCANRICVNPSHLELASDHQNMSEMLYRKHLINRVKELEEENAHLKGAIAEEFKPSRNTCEFTEAQVEAAAKALHETRNPWIGAYGDWGAAGYEIKQAFRESARAALVAAARAAQSAVPQESSRLPDFFAPKPMPNGYIPAPVLPSSGVDEDALAEVIGRDENYTSDLELGGWTLSPRLAARAVAEWLKGQGR